MLIMLNAISVIGLLIMKRPHPAIADTPARHYVSGNVILSFPLSYSTELS